MAVFKILGPNSVGENCCVTHLGHSSDFECKQWIDATDFMIGHDDDAKDFATVDLLNQIIAEKAGGAGGADGNTAMN